jgi:hypothetical protein
MANQVEGVPREAVNPRHRHHVAGGGGFQHFEKFAPVATRAMLQNFASINRSGCRIRAYYVKVEN